MAAGRHPGRFPSLPDGTVQEVGPPYPAQLRGVAISVWSDVPDAQTPREVAAAVRRPVRAMAERAWNAGGRLTHAELVEIGTRIGVAGPSVLSG